MYRQAVQVRVREWDPRTASAGEIRSLVETYNAVLAADLPDDPPWQDVQVVDYLAQTMPGERRISWVAEDDRLPEGESTIYGHVSVLLLGDRSTHGQKSVVATIHAGLPHSTIVPLPGQAHAAQITAPHLIADALLHPHPAPVSAPHR